MAGQKLENLRIRGWDFWLLGVLGVLSAIGVAICLAHALLVSIFGPPPVWQDVARVVWPWFIPVVAGIILAVVFRRTALIVLQVVLLLVDLLCVFGPAELRADVVGAIGHVVEQAGGQGFPAQRV